MSLTARVVRIETNLTRDDVEFEVLTEMRMKDEIN